MGSCLIAIEAGQTKKAPESLDSELRPVKCALRDDARTILGLFYQLLTRPELARLRELAP
jgi:hypothetical protein